MDSDCRTGDKSMAFDCTTEVLYALNPFDVRVVIGQIRHRPNNGIDWPSVGAIHAVNVEFLAAPPVLQLIYTKCG